MSVQAVELEQGRQLEKIDKTDLMRAQLEDKSIEPVYRIVEAGSKV